MLVVYKLLAQKMLANLDAMLCDLFSLHRLSAC